MQSLPMRPLLRTAPRSVRVKLNTNLVSRRGFASQISEGDSTRSVPPDPAGGSSKLPFVIGAAVIFSVVAGRYILASDKPARSEHAMQQELRRQRDPSKEFRDPRDSGVKTLAQKAEKEQRS